MPTIRQLNLLGEIELCNKELKPVVFGVGDRVKRKPVNNFDRNGGEGTIIKTLPGNRNYIKWDIKQATGQQHSTIQSKFLDRILPDS